MDRNFSLFFIIHAIICQVANGSCKILLPNNEKNQFLVLAENCLKRIIIEEDLSKVLVLINNEHMDLFDVKAVIDITSVKLFTNVDSTGLPEGTIHFKRMAYLFLVASPEEMEIYLQKLFSHPEYNIRGYYIIIPIKDFTQKQIFTISKILVKSRTTNFLIFHNYSNELEIFSNFPYSQGQCGLYSPKNDAVLMRCYKNGTIRYLSPLNPKEYYPTYERSKIFPSKIPLNLEGCEIRVVTGLYPPNVIDVERKSYPGIEIDFINTLAKHMNFVPIYIQTNEIVGERLPNGSWDGFMGYLERNEADLAIGAVHLDRSRMHIFEQTHWYLSNYILVITPIASKKYKHEFIQYLIVNSSTSAKVCFILSYFCYCIGCYILSKLGTAPELEDYSNLRRIPFNLFQMFLTQPRQSLPKTVKIRWIVGSWLVFCTIVAFFFQTSITSFLTSPKRPREIGSIKEVLESDLTITYEPFYNGIVSGMTHGNELIKRNKKYPVIKSLNMVARGEAMTIADRLRIIYITQQWMHEDGTIPVWVLGEESTHFYWVQAVMTKGHPLFKWFDEMAQSAGNNGFWNFMKSRYINRRKILCTVRQEIVRFNHVNGINNTDAMNKYNDALYEPFPSHLFNKAVGKFFQPTPVTEKELLDRFDVEDENSSISYEDLRTVFRLGIFALAICIGVFILEIIFAVVINRRKLRNYSIRSVCNMLYEIRN